MKCQCGCAEFIARQVIRADIVVDDSGAFLRNVEGGLEAGVYDSSTPYGPFTCVKCGTEYEELT